MTRPFKRGLVACIMTLAAFPALAQSIPCGEPYTVRRGDTLQRIAIRAYGPAASYRDLLEPNRSVFLRGDPSLLAVGQVLSIPCRGATATAEPAPATPQPQAASAPPDRAAPRGPSIVAVESALAPAMAPTLSAALARADLGDAAEVSPVRDIATLPAVLRASPGPAIATGVPRLPCDDTAALSEGAQAICRNVAWSVPLGETVLATFSLAKAEPITGDAALAGKRLCIAEGVPRALLEARGLQEPAVTMRGEATAEGCFTLLRDGLADAALVPAAAADAALMAMPPGEPLTEQFALAQLVSLHAVALRDDPAALAALARLDAAVEAMRADGSWLSALGAAQPN